MGSGRCALPPTACGSKEGASRRLFAARLKPCPDTKQQAVASGDPSLRIEAGPARDPNLVSLAIYFALIHADWTDCSREARLSVPI